MVTHKIPLCTEPYVFSMMHTPAGIAVVLYNGDKSKAFTPLAAHNRVDPSWDNPIYRHMTSLTDATCKDLIK